VLFCCHAPPGPSGSGSGFQRVGPSFGRAGIVDTTRTHTPAHPHAPSHTGGRTRTHKRAQARVNLHVLKLTHACTRTRTRALTNARTQTSRDAAVSAQGMPQEAYRMGARGRYWDRPVGVRCVPAGRVRHGRRGRRADVLRVFQADGRCVPRGVRALARFI
jgi:hypothetical protein